MSQLVCSKSAEIKAARDDCVSRDKNIRGQATMRPFTERKLCELDVWGAELDGIVVG
jgi:hypothetical protein